MHTARTSKILRLTRSKIQLTILQSFKLKDLKVPITPKIFFCLDEWLCHAEQNDEKIFVFDQNWNFL